MLRLLGKIGIAREAGTSKHEAGTPLWFLKVVGTTKHVEITWQILNYKRSWNLEAQSWNPLGLLKNTTGQRPAPRLQDMLRLRGKIGIAREAPRFQNMLRLLCKLELQEVGLQTNFHRFCFTF